MIGSLSCGEFYPNPYLTLPKARLLLHFVIRVKAVTVSNRQRRRPRQSHLTTRGMFDITSFFLAIVTRMRTQENQYTLVYRR